MWFAVKRLALGVFLIALVSAVLLISDSNRRVSGTKHLPRVAVFQHASQAVLDEGVQGMLDGLAESGWKDGDTIALARFNAENDIPTANVIAKEITDGRFDLILTASTLSLQVVAGANKAGKTKHVFGLVTDPFGAGVGISRDNPLDHPRHLVGYGTFQPVGDVFRLAKKLFPGLTTVGVVWNPAEANSEANTKKAREVSRQMGLTLLEAHADNSSGVAEAAGSLAGRGAQALWVGGDVTVLVAFDAVVAVAKKAGIPVFTNIPPSAERGALFDLGADYHEVGRLAGVLAGRVLHGTDPATIPVTNVVPERLVVNPQALAGLRQPWRLDEETLRRAETVVGRKGGERRPSAAARPVGKKWRVPVIHFVDSPASEAAGDGVLAGLRESGLAEGRDYEVMVRNAQGDVATANSLMDAALADGADLFITLSTPTLQVALNRVKAQPVIFSMVGNPVLAGAGTSHTAHRPNVTGIFTTSDFDGMMAVVRQVLPKARVVGTLFVPSEVNSVFYKDSLVEAARKAGIDVLTVPASTSVEVPDAALSLAGRRLDAICQISDNLTGASFVSIAQAAKRAKLPLFGFQSAQAKSGAVVTLSRDFEEAGREAGLLAARVIRGESPQGIPFQGVRKNTLVVNLAAARELGLTLPPSLIARADEVIGR